MTRWTVVGVLAAVLSLTPLAIANVFSMPSGLTSLEMVTVGNPGNLDDSTATGAYGSVAYEYRIGKFEVTAAQYCKFLNATARNDPYGLYGENMAPSLYGAPCRIERTGSPGDYAYGVASQFANKPVNHVSWGDAARFANWISNGQPTGILTGDPTQDAWIGLR